MWRQRRWLSHITNTVFAVLPFPHHLLSNQSPFFLSDKQERDCLVIDSTSLASTRFFNSYLECQSFLILIYFLCSFLHHIYPPSISSPTISSCTFTSPHDVFCFRLFFLINILLLFATQASLSHGPKRISFSELWEETSPPWLPPPMVGF